MEIKEDTKSVLPNKPPAPPRSKVARFGHMYKAAAVLNKRPHEAKMANTIISKFLADPKRFPGMRAGSIGTYAMAAYVPNGAVAPQWYGKTGCCASIGTFGPSRGTMWYYIPHIYPLSKGKKIAYINELSEFFGGAIKFAEIQNSADGLSIPGTDKLFKPTLNGSPDDVYSTPQAWGDFKEWIVVEATITKNIHKLLFLQFLRALYTYPEVQLTSSYDNNTHNGLLNQPQLYFRLKRMFPTMLREHLLYLSFTMSGSAISSTYFPYYFYTYRPTGRGVNVANISGDINSFFSYLGNSETKARLIPEGNWYNIDPPTDVTRVTRAVLQLTADETRLKAPAGGFASTYSVIASELYKNFLIGTKASYTRTINWLGHIHGNKELLKVIE